MPKQIRCAAALICALAASSAHAQAAASRYKFERGFPAAGTAEKAYDAADLRRAIEAYKFFYRTVATEAVMQQMLAAGAKVNEVGIVMATGPRQQFGGANADTPYAITTVDLKAAGPMVVELPPGPFIGFVDDHNMRWVQDMGTIGPEKGQGGKHLILPPDYTGAVPEGYYAGRSKTWKVVVFVRIMPVGGDVAKALQAVNGIKVYPLAKAGQPVTHRFIDVSAKTMPLPILTWEDNAGLLAATARRDPDRDGPGGIPPHARHVGLAGDRAGQALQPRRPDAAHSRGSGPHRGGGDEGCPLRQPQSRAHRLEGSHVGVVPAAAHQRADGGLRCSGLPRPRVQRRVFLARLRRFGGDRQAGGRRGLGLLDGLPRRNGRIPRRRQDLQADRPRPGAGEAVLVNDRLRRGHALPDRHRPGPGRDTLAPGQAAGQRGRLLRPLLRPEGSGGQGRHVGQDHPGQRVVVRLPHLRPASAGFRRHVEAQRHQEVREAKERHH